MLRPGEQVALVGELDDLAEIHHRDAVADVLDHREVVGDEEIGEPELALQVGQEVYYLRLHRDVESRDRLVADDQARVQGQRPGNTDALALAAREFVRKAVERLGAQAHLESQLGYSIFQLAAAGDAVIDERLPNDVANSEPRVERGVGVLEDHLQPAPPGPHLAPR